MSTVAISGSDPRPDHSVSVSSPRDLCRPASEIEAEYAAVELIKQDPKLVGIVLNDSGDPPRIHVEDIDEVEPEEMPGVAPGFSFYPANQDAEE
jgi:hypothetical protein